MHSPVAHFVLLAALAALPSRVLIADDDTAVTAPALDFTKVWYDELLPTEVYAVVSEPGDDYEPVHGAPACRIGLGIVDTARLWLTPPIRDRCRMRLAAAPDSD